MYHCHYLVWESFLTFNYSTSAGSINAANKNLTWGKLALINAQRIMNLTEAFAKNQTKRNLIHLKDGQVVGQWRDSEYGMTPS